MTTLPVARLAPPVPVACGTTAVGPEHAPSVSLQRAAAPAPAARLVGFDDERGEPPAWLRAIRGGFGNPPKNLEPERPVADIVQTAPADGLRARGVPLFDASPARQIHGVVRRMDCNPPVRRESTVALEVSVLDGGGEVLPTRGFKATRSESSPLASGVFASVDHLRIQRELTLREAVDRALDDAGLRAAMRP